MPVWDASTSRSQHIAAGTATFCKHLDTAPHRQTDKLSLSVWLRVFQPVHEFALSCDHVILHLRNLQLKIHLRFGSCALAIFFAFGLTAVFVHAIAPHIGCLGNNAKFWGGGLCNPSWTPQAHRSKQQALVWKGLYFREVFFLCFVWA